MKIYVNNGITNLDEIRNHYNRFDGGGFTNPYRHGDIYKESEECAYFSNHTLNDQGYMMSGNAWTPRGGDIIYNGFDSQKRPKSYNEKTYDAYARGAVKDIYDNFVTKDTLDPDQVYTVNMYYKTSPNKEKAFNDGKEVFGTHTGYLNFDPKDKQWYVTHNIHGKIYKQRFFDLQNSNGNVGVTAIFQPRKNTIVNRIKTKLGFEEGGPINKLTEGGLENKRPTRQEYLQAKADAIRQQALDYSLSRTDTAIPMVANSVSEEEFEYNRKQELELFRDELRNLLLEESPYSPKYDKSKIKALEGYIEYLENKKYNPLMPGNSCIYTATDNYSQDGINRRVSGNLTFNDDPSKYGFVSTTKENLLPGDLVQEIIGDDRHMLMFDSYDESGKPLFNYSSSQSYTDDDLRKKARYPLGGDEFIKYYTFVGTPEDKDRWTKEYFEEYYPIDNRIMVGIEEALAEANKKKCGGKLNKYSDGGYTSPIHLPSLEEVKMNALHQENNQIKGQSLYNSAINKINSNIQNIQNVGPSIQKAAEVQRQEKVNDVYNAKLMGKSLGTAASLVGLYSNLSTLNSGLGVSNTSEGVGLLGDMALDSAKNKTSSTALKKVGKYYSSIKPFLK